MAKRNEEVAHFESNFLMNNDFIEVLGSVSKFKVLLLNKVFNKEIFTYYKKFFVF